VASRPLILVPAHGRDYSVQADVLTAWYEGKDFLICDISNRWDGKPCSSRDAEHIRASGYDAVKIHFAKLARTTIIEV